MADGILSYPPDIVDAVVSAHRAAQALNQEMADVKTIATALAVSGQGAAIQAFTEVTEMWQKSGLAHNETLSRVATEAGKSYDEITQFDAYLNSQLRG